MSDLTLYTFGTPNGHQASIALEELGLQYKAESIDISKNIQKEEWFLKINPNGRIPALTDGKLNVFETCAILLYLGDKYDKDNKISFEHGSDEYYQALSWIMFKQGGIGPMQGQANHFKLMCSVKSDYAINRYVEETKRLYGVLERQLSKTDYLVGNKYSIADIAAWCWVVYAEHLDIDLSEFPGVKAWVERIAAREAVKKGKQVPPSTKTPEELKEMFKSMKEKVAAMENTDKH
ncbi:glutathione S-transferase [Protomyces lactucae-debilis]|uniref:Glutathione S-transferase n=1 Tax=Protomyces lactucae-debilis TaxID=2754530 RepID=A0A1Y2FAL8_PROLT|nr:glutathione S-transferase [Protomyces lactucae-debilis]ORY80386.1 glutathione S-transferase [Protomyces lactucae-debilis]